MNKKTKNITYISVITALISIVAPFIVVLPFTPVPISLATMIIYICAVATDWKKVTLAVILYIIIGAIGVPVFSGYSGGFAHITGPTGGYIVGYIFCALFTGLSADLFPQKRIAHASGMLIGTMLCYISGTIWLCRISDIDFIKGLIIGVVPYVPGDIIKIIISAIIGIKIRKQLKYI